MSFWTGNASDKYFTYTNFNTECIKTYLKQHNEFRWYAKFSQNLCNISLLTDSRAFLKSINSWCTFHFTRSVTDELYAIWSVVDILRRNPNWWPPKVSSPYGAVLERRTLNKSSHEVDNSDIPTWSLQSALSSFSWIDAIICYLAAVQFLSYSK
jgi:hypothetical protein